VPSALRLLLTFHAKLSPRDRLQALSPDALTAVGTLAEAAVTQTFLCRKHVLKSLLRQTFVAKGRFSVEFTVCSIENVGVDI